MGTFRNAPLYEYENTNAPEYEAWREHRPRKFAPTSARKRGFDKRSAVVLVACLLLVAVCGCMTVWLAQGGPDSAAGDTPNNQSTPQSEWTQGVMPYLYQTDPQWSEHAYAESKFGESGCGPTCLAMVYIYLTGDQSMSPPDISDMAERLNCAGPEGTSWLFMVAGADELGIHGEETSLDESTVYDELSSGHPIICSMGPGDFTSVGHFIVLTGMTEDGLVTVRDPNSVERSSQTWSLDTIRGQYVNAWVYSS